jgi:hypothetical protein
MRLALLLALTLAAAAPAAVEQFTLADGRTFVGEYDDEAGQLHTLIAGKAVSLAVAKDQIAERAVWKPAKAAAVAAPAPAAEKAPKTMTPAEKAAAERNAAAERKEREADQLAADAAKAKRDAAGARADAERKVAEAKNHWRAFRKRAEAEGMSLDEEPPKELIILPRTFGNDQKTLDAMALSKKALANAEGFDALAARLQAQSEATRREAGMMPRTDR